MHCVLVTGAGGFIGSHLVEDQLAKGRTVRAFDVNLARLSHLAGQSKCELILGDVRNGKAVDSALRGVDVVFHLASAHLEVSKSDSHFYEVNVHAVSELLTAAVRRHVGRVVHCSSVGVYGPLTSLPADEATECHPDIAYEITKLEGERLVAQFRNQVSTVIVRPAWVYGPRCLRTLKLFRAIAKRRFVMVGKGENFRHPVYIDDMLAAFELAARRPDIDGETFIIASDEAVRLRELVDEIVRVQGLNYRPMRLPLPLVWSMCYAVEKVFSLLDREPPFSTRSVKFFTESSAFNISWAEKRLGYRPHTSLRDGLAATHEQFRRDGLL